MPERIRGCRRSIAGYSAGSLPSRIFRRRRSVIPSGISSRPIRKIVGKTMNATIPA
jgi:hypothetical protein